MIRHTDMVKSVVMIDAVCFQIYDSTLAYQFVHRIPKTASEYLTHWFISRELYISHFICRHFIWHHNVLFPENLPKHAHVFIANDDNLINGPSVAKYLKKHKVSHTLFKNMDHAQFMLKSRDEDLVVKKITTVIHNSYKKNTKNSQDSAYNSSEDDATTMFKFNLL